MLRGGSEGLFRASLGTDNRDAIASADYLRFGLSVRSRYAACSTRRAPRSAARKAPLSSTLEVSPTWRAPSRRFVAVLRTQAAADSRRAAAHGRRNESIPRARLGVGDRLPVVLDEPWFRVVRGRANHSKRSTLEPREIGDNDAKRQSESKPFRAAPLPDHHVVPATRRSQEPYDLKPGADPRSRCSARTSSSLCSAPALQVRAVRLHARSSRQPRAWPTRRPSSSIRRLDVGPHWWDGRLRVAAWTAVVRRRAEPYTARRSEPSDIQNLYTLPGNLTSAVKPTSSRTLHKEPQHRAAGSTLHLEPTPATAA